MHKLLVFHSPENLDGVGNGATSPGLSSLPGTAGGSDALLLAPSSVHAAIGRHQADLRAVGEELGARVIRSLQATLLAHDPTSSDVLHRSVTRLDEAERTRIRSALRAGSPAGAKAAGAPGFPKLTLSKVAQSVITQVLEDTKTAASSTITPNANVQPQPRYKTIQFHWDKVTCVDDSTDFGKNDELLVWGMGIGPFGQTFDSAIYGPYSLGDNESHAPGPKLLAELSLRDDLDGLAPWPQTYECLIVLGERDKGGLIDIIKEIWDKVGDEVSTLVTTLIGAGIGAALGTALGTSILPIIGTLVGAALGAIIGFLIGLLNNPDDLLGTKTWTVTLQSNTHAYLNQLTGGDRKSDPRTFTFAAMGGRWTVRARWSVK